MSAGMLWTHSAAVAHKTRSENSFLAYITKISKILALLFLVYMQNRESIWRTGDGKSNKTGGIMRTSNATEYVFFTEIPPGKDAVFLWCVFHILESSLDRTALKHLIIFFITPFYQDKVQWKRRINIKRKPIRNQKRQTQEEVWRKRRQLKLSDSAP